MLRETSLKKRRCFRWKIEISSEVIDKIVETYLLLRQRKNKRKTFTGGPRYSRTFYPRIRLFTFEK
jgi:hypothetical protein